VNVIIAEERIVNGKMEFLTIGTAAGNKKPSSIANERASRDKEQMLDYT